MVNNKILIVDDEVDLAFIMSEMLSEYGYDVTCVKDAQDAYNAMENNVYSVILLDINLPDGDGFSICREIRKISDTPIIFASARNQEIDRITGFDIGGDDYIQKPYSMKELLSRVNAIIRRSYGYEKMEKMVCFGKVKVNITSRTVYKGDEIVPLSLKEFDLLAYLCEHKNIAVDKDELITKIWGTFSSVEMSTLTVHIRWLREKIEDNPSKPVYIKTVFKVGYMLEIKE